MKSLNKSIVTAALLVTAASATLASPQYKPTGDDGITASPRLRQTLDERAAAKRVTQQPVNPVITYKYQGTLATAASPKLQQLQGQRKLVANTDSEQFVGYRPTGADGVTASPKLRQQLDQAAPPVMIAPVK